MKKLRNIIFWRNSASAPFGPNIDGQHDENSLEKEMQIPIRVPTPTYVQIDPDSGERQVYLPPESPEPGSELYRRLIEEAPNIPGITDKKTMSEVQVQWIDPEKLQDGRLFIRRHFFSILFSHLIGILLIIAIKPIQSLLLRTTKTHKKKYSLTLHLKCLLQIFDWYEHATDLADSSTMTMTEFQRVREIFENAALSFRKFIPPVAGDLKLGSQKECRLYTAFRDDLQATGHTVEGLELRTAEKIRTTVNPTVPCSQFDLAMTQFAFFGPILLFPRIFGIWEDQGSGQGKGIEGFVHIWAVIGHKIGLMEEFNLALQQNSCPGSTDLVKIWSKIFFFSFRLADDLTFRLWKVLIYGFSKYFIWVRADVLLNFIARDLFKIYEESPETHRSRMKAKKRNLSNIMSFIHKCYYFILSLTLRISLRCFLFRVFLNANARFLLHLAKIRFLQDKRGSRRGEDEESRKTISSTTLDRWASCQNVTVISNDKTESVA